MEEITSIPCIKCGREITPGAVFCAECLADMEKHPVKPGTPVVLHTKPTTSIRRAPSRKVRKPEEQIRSLKRTITWLWVLICLLIAGLGVTGYLLLTAPDTQSNVTGHGDNYQTTQTNYST